MDDYQDYDAVGLAQLVASRQVTAGELLEAARARMVQVNGRLNAVVVDVEPPPAVENGPFSGVPFLIKDLGQDLAGYPTSDGTRALARTPARETATIVQRWLESGLVVFGKTNVPEFGAKAVTESAVFGPARNPWNLGHTPAGSSGGSAAAVAARIVPCAGANDGGGSIRIPASACGLFGLKPSRGRVPFGPVYAEPVTGTAAHGVVSRSVRDTAAMLDVISGPTPVSPFLTPADRLTPEVGQDPGRLRIGLCTASSINPSPHPEALAAARAAAELLTELGHEVVELPRAPFDDAALAKDFLTTWFVSAALGLEEAKARSGATDAEFEPDTLIMAALGRATRPVHLLRAIERRHEYVRQLAHFHETHDLLLTPTTATPPPRIGAFDPPPSLRRTQEALLKVRAGGLLRFTPVIDKMISDHLGWVPYTQLANLTGRPAMSVPLYWTAEGLPIGAQFVGRLGAEGQLIRVASQLEQARPWADRRPPL